VRLVRRPLCNLIPSSVGRITATVDIHCDGERNGASHVEEGVQRVETGGSVEEGSIERRWPEYGWEEVAGADEGPYSDEHREIDLARIAFAAGNLVPV